MRCQERGVDIFVSIHLMIIILAVFAVESQPLRVVISYEEELRTNDNRIPHLYMHGRQAKIILIQISLKPRAA